MTVVARWHDFAYEQTDIPAGLSVRDWRLERARTRATSRPWWRMIGALPWGTPRRRGTAAGKRCAA
jgi:hypothetical protein